jgi:hypothetical protein
MMKHDGTAMSQQSRLIAVPKAKVKRQKAKVSAGYESDILNLATCLLMDS